MACHPSSCCARVPSWHSTTPTPTPTSSPTSSRGSSRERRRVVQLAVGITSGNRACRTCRRGSSRVSVSVSASWNSSFSAVVWLICLSAVVGRHVAGVESGRLRRYRHRAGSRRSDLDARHRPLQLVSPQTSNILSRLLTSN